MRKYHTIRWESRIFSLLWLQVHKNTFLKAWKWRHKIIIVKILDFFFFSFETSFVLIITLLEVSTSLGLSFLSVDHSGELRGLSLRHWFQAPVTLFLRDQLSKCYAICFPWFGAWAKQALSQTCSPLKLLSTPTHSSALASAYAMPSRMPTFLCGLFHPLTTAGLLPGRPYMMSSLPVNIHQAVTFERLREPHLFSGTFQPEGSPTVSSSQGPSECLAVSPLWAQQGLAPGARGRACLDCGPHTTPNKNRLLTTGIFVGQGLSWTNFPGEIWGLRTTQSWTLAQGLKKLHLVWTWGACPLQSIA